MPQPRWKPIPSPEAFFTEQHAKRSTTDSLLLRFEGPDDFQGWRVADEDMVLLVEAVEVRGRPADPVRDRPLLPILERERGYQQRLQGRHEQVRIRKGHPWRILALPEGVSLELRYPKTPQTLLGIGRPRERPHSGDVLPAMLAAAGLVGVGLACAGLWALVARARTQETDGV